MILTALAFPTLNEDQNRTRHGKDFVNIKMLYHTSDTETLQSNMCSLILPIHINEFNKCLLKIFKKLDPLLDSKNAD